MAEDPLRAALHDRGFAIVDGVVGEAELAALRSEAGRLAAASRTRGGARGLLRRSERFARLASRGPVADLARRLIGGPAPARKLTLFDKRRGANWKIRWHQDVAITVRHRRPVAGFSGWSEKEGILHVRPPAPVLEEVLALRLHLDPTPEENGALRVIPGSHRAGRLSPAGIEALRARCAPVTCEVCAGGVMAMRPLLVHASSAAARPTHRRVLHFEFAATALPGGLEWA